MCLVEAENQRQVNGNFRFDPGPDHLITLAGGVDVEETNTLQGALSKIVDAEVMARLLCKYESQRERKQHASPRGRGPQQKRFDQCLRFAC